MKYKFTKIILLTAVVAGSHNGLQHLPVRTSPQAKDMNSITYWI